MRFKIILGIFSLLLLSLVISGCAEGWTAAGKATATGEPTTQLLGATFATPGKGGGFTSLQFPSGVAYTAQVFPLTLTLATVKFYGPSSTAPPIYETSISAGQSLDLDVNADGTKELRMEHKLESARGEPLIFFYALIYSTTSTSDGTLPAGNTTPTTGNLFVTSNPSDALVYADGVFKGMTKSSGSFLISDLAGGTHQIKITKSGYNNYAVNQVIVNGQASSLSAYLSIIPIVTTTTGNLSVVTTPAGANVYVDNILKGIAPITVGGLSVGDHILKITKSGYQDYTATQTITAGQTTSFGISLAVAWNATGTLSVTSNPTTAGLYIDGVYRGVTPLTISGILPGTHTFKVTKTNYVDYSNTFTAYAGATNSTVVNLISLQNTTTTNTTTTAQTGSLSVVTTPGEAYVYVGQVLKGVTDPATKKLTVPGLAVGSYVIIVGKSGYQNYTITKSIVANQATPLLVTLKLK